MSHFIIYRNRFRNDRVLHWLIQEFKSLIPDFDPYGEDGYLLNFAYKDLKATIAASKKVKGILGIRKKIDRLVESNPEEFRSFLKVWVNRWLEKWRERVILFDEKDEKHGENEEKIRNARRIYRKLKGRNELTKLVQQTLIEHGEVCMVKLIAENLILGEISKYIAEREKKGLTIFEPNPIKIYQRITRQIRKITERKEPLVHLRLRPFNPYYI